MTDVKIELELTLIYVSISACVPLITLMSLLDKTRTVKVSSVSLGATEQDIQEFFSFSGVIEYIEMKSENERSQCAFVTFKDAQGAETAVLLSGATIVDQSVTIALEQNYTLPAAAASKASENSTAGGGVVAVAQKAEDVVSGMLAKGYVLGQDALNRAKSFDERHQLISTATAKVASLDQKIGLSEKITVGATIVNDKVKEVDQKFQVSEKTKTAFAAAEQTVSSAGSAILKNQYILTGATWVTGALSRVRKAAAEKSQEKVGEEEQGRNAAEGYSQLDGTGSPTPAPALAPAPTPSDKKPDSRFAKGLDSLNCVGVGNNLCKYLLHEFEVESFSKKLALF